MERISTDNYIPYYTKIKMNKINCSILLAIAFLLTGCPPATTEPDTPSKKLPPAAAIGIVPPHGSPSSAYCNIEGDSLIVSFRNSGGAPSVGGVTVTVTFNGQTSIQRRMPAIDAGQTKRIPFPIPSGCFGSDCSFKISWSNQPVVKGICIG